MLFAVFATFQFIRLAHSYLLLYNEMKEKIMPPERRGMNEYKGRKQVR